jgi:hypothetical protein
MSSLQQKINFYCEIEHSQVEFCLLTINCVTFNSKLAFLFGHYIIQTQKERERELKKILHAIIQIIPGLEALNLFHSRNKNIFSSLYFWFVTMKTETTGIVTKPMKIYSRKKKIGTIIALLVNFILGDFLIMSLARIYAR